MHAQMDTQLAFYVGAGAEELFLYWMWFICIYARIIFIAASCLQLTKL